MVRIKPRTSIPGVSPYVIRDPYTEEIHYKVPPECIRWPQEFRMRIVRDLRNDEFMTTKQAESYERYMTVTPFTVQRMAVRFVVLRDPVTTKQKEYIRTLLHAECYAHAIELYHPNPAVRSLMVYAYLTNTRIGGMPRLRESLEFR